MQGIRQLLFLCALALTFYARTAPAETLEGLFEVEIPVQNQGSDERTRAIQTGFYELILRLAGTRDAANSPAANALAAKAAEYVVQYRYRIIPPTPLVTPPLGAPAPVVPIPAPVATENKQVLWVLFDSESVSQALFKGNLPFWGRSRPNLVVWLVLEDDERRRQLVDATIPSPFVDAIVARAKLRGIPLVFPTLDLQDQAALTASDAWAKQSDRILKASTRYKSDGVLLGRIQPDGHGRWMTRWSLYMNGGDLSWEQSQELVTFGEAIDRVADDLGRKLAQAATGNTPSSTTITVNEVKTLENYLKTLRYLESLEPVARARVVQVDGTRAIYQLELRGTSESLTRAIGLNNVLIVEQAATPPGDVTLNTAAPLVYRLVP